MFFDATLAGANDNVNLSFMTALYATRGRPDKNAGASIMAAESSWTHYRSTPLRLLPLPWPHCPIPPD
jgi:hypothetical protein